MYQLDPIMGGDRFTQPVQPRVSRLQTVPSFKQFAYNHSAATHQKVAEWADSYFQPLLIVYGTMRYHNIRHDLGVRILIPFPTYPPRGLKPLDGTDIAIFLYERWSKRKNAYFNEHPPNALKIIICRGETTSDWQVMHNTFPVCVGLFAEYPRLPQATKYAFHSCSSAPEQCRPFWEDESHSAAMYMVYPNGVPLVRFHSQVHLGWGKMGGTEAGRIDPCVRAGRLAADMEVGD